MVFSADPDKFSMRWWVSLNTPENASANAR